MNNLKYDRKLRKITYKKAFVCHKYAYDCEQFCLFSMCVSNLKVSDFEFA